MIKVYCERGAYRKELGQLKNDGVIQLIHFPYEGHAKKLEITDVPSVVTEDMTHMTCDSSIRIGDCVGSEKIDVIRSIIGNQEIDARHIDTAYRNNCDIFLSRDKDDVISYAVELKEALGIEFLHPDDDWGYFLTAVGKNTDVDDA